jgi:hypothetical protein
MSEEVKEVIEALMSIYEEDMQILNEPPNRYVISMHVRTMNEIEDCPTVTLKITYPDGYPQNENLIIEFDYEEEEPDIDDDDLKDLRICLENTMEENKGDVMTFLVISAAIEWLESHHGLMKAMADAKLRAKKDAEEAILTQKLVGTKVTVENFMAWKTEFDIKRLAGKKSSKVEGKKSGRELFLENADLNASDLQFISTEESVDFDEALFDDMDGLDIEDED